MKLKRILMLAAAGILAATTVRAGLVNVTNDINEGVSATWYATNTYVLQTVVYVRSNAVLTIEPGTVVKGATNVNTLIARDGLQDLVSALWVAQGGKLYATGTVDRPIIMTFEGDNVNDPYDIPPTLTGQWGGIVLMGRATINSAQFAAGQAATPKYDRYEGVLNNGTNNVHVFGGSDDADSSGALRYVSIRHTGHEFAPAKELNGLTMGGVGSGTVIEYVEVFACSDDAFEWWGGTVSARHLVAAFCEDDDFDTDQGYRGTNQFWFGIKPTWQGSTDSRGFETDGDLSQSGYPGNNAAPTSTWVVYNATLIGRGTNATGFGGGIGWNARDEARPNVYDTVFSDFATGMLIDVDGTNEFATGVADVRNTIFNVAAPLSGVNTQAVAFLFSDISHSNTVQSALLGGVSYTNNLGLNPRPQAGSPALSNVLPQAAGLEQVNYRGAFSPNDNWADGWTALSQLHYLNDGTRIVNVTNDINEGVSATWYATNTYVLQTVVYVRSNAVLTIEPGTVVKGATNVNTLIARDGLQDLVSALWVAQGGKLYATGTVDRPIIMTFEGDNVNDPYDIPPTLTGQWGGIVLMGRATINSAQFAAGQAATPKYDRYEGVLNNGTNNVHVFGGSDDADSSGALRYVSIRHTGHEFAPAKELNGLTMGGVGSGTVIEYVEVFACSDDAFEWWGGTVSARHLVAAFCEDDDFDTDQGYRGTNQFWFGIKPTWQGSTDSRGFETDGDLSQSGYPGNNAAPTSTWVVYNATLIGRGTNATGFGGGIGWNARDEARPNVYDTVFSDFATGMLIDVDGTNEFATGVADVRNTIFNVAAPLSGVNTQAVAFLFSDISHSNTVQSALLGGVSYTNNLGLNPRPQAGSPALSNVLPQAAGLEQVNYRGAFGTNDFWAHRWTALYKLGYLQDTWYAPAMVVLPPTAPVLAALVTGGNAQISFATQTGHTYQVQSATNLSSSPINWLDEGAPISGSGSTVTGSVPASVEQKFFRVKAQ